MKKTVIFWTLSFVITLATAYYQRVTGPTYPLSGKIIVSGQTVKYKLERSHSTSSDAEISIPASGNLSGAKLFWKRYKTQDSFSGIDMISKDGNLSASLPKQPSAGKLEYYITAAADNNDVRIPENNNVVIRYKGDVPAWILIPHIIAMFGTMLLSTRTGFEFFNRKNNLKKLTFWTLGFLVAGGMILGPLTQLYAFNALWTGYPFGTDLTDNKTLFALIGWIIALIALYKSKKPEAWALFAAVLLLVVYMIPHSMFGSELDYSKTSAGHKTETTKSTP